MRDRRVVYDSEDEDEGFSPVNSPAKGGEPAVVLTTDDDDKAGGAGHVDELTSDSRSTDPEFFKSIYEHQQRQQDATAETFPVPPGPGQQRSSDKQKSSDPKAKDNSSSITDPTLKSARKRAMGRVDAKDFASLTQVTTPSAPSAKQKDVYDFPLSDEEGVPRGEPAFLRMRARKTRNKEESTQGKRKREQRPADPEDALTTSSPSQPLTRARGSCPSHAIQIEDDSSPRPAKKKRNRIQRQDQRQAPDDVDLLVIPTTAEMEDPLTETYAGINDQGSVVRDTFDMPPPSIDPPPASFFIAPPARLSASQKQEYLPVSGSSELDDVEGRQEPSLPPPKPPQTQGELPPNTDSTILYTTPSRYCPSAPPLPLVSSPHLASSSARKTQLGATHPQSSPDELTSHPPERTSRSLKRKRDGPELNETAQDDSWDSDKIGYHRETYVPRPSRRRSRAVVEGDEDLDATDQSMPDTCPPGVGSFDHMENADPIPIFPGNDPPQDNMEGIKGIEGLDPEFLEAMPEDIRREIISNHILQQSARDSQAPQTRSRGRPSGNSSRLQPASDETPQPKKRGRKKKEQQAESAPLTAEEAGEQSGTAPTATAKRKRGRPRKGEVVQPPAATEGDDLATVMDTAELVPSIPGTDIAVSLPVEPAQDVVAAPKAPSRRGRKKKVLDTSTTAVLNEPDIVLEAEETPRDTSEAPEFASEQQADDTVEPTRAEDEREALRDISNTASQNASDTFNSPENTVSQEVEKQQDVTPEPEAKGIPRSASTTGQQGKVPFRVGLSKKSRITPLLKMIRK